MRHVMSVRYIINGQLLFFMSCSDGQAASIFCGKNTGLKNRRPMKKAYSFHIPVDSRAMRTQAPLDFFLVNGLGVDSLLDSEVSD